MEDGVALVPLEGEQGPRIGLRDPRTVQFIDRLSAEFDLVVLDCGPLVDENKFLEGGDACPLNAAIVVRDMRTTSEDDCQATVARLLNHGVEAIGIAENFNR
jgi:Mrp family chromosome partitioning ATPase